MTTARALSLLFFLSFAVFTITATPLGVVLERSGLSGKAVTWHRSHGTILGGTISGLNAAGIALGEVELAAKSLTFLSARAGYRFVLNGPPGRSSGQLVAARSGTKLSDLSADLSLAAFPDLAPALRATASTAGLREGAVSFSDSGCIEASGQIETDLLRNFAATLNLEASELSGAVTCKDGAVRFDLSGRLRADEEVTVAANLRVNQPSDFTVHIVTNDASLVLGLAQYGFTEDATGIIYQTRFSLHGGF